MPQYEVGHLDRLRRPLATDPAAKHLAHVSTFNVGVTVAAANLGLIYRGCYYHLLASYDDGELARFGPGGFHLQELLRMAFERGHPEGRDRAHG